MAVKEKGRVNMLPQHLNLSEGQEYKLVSCTFVLAAKSNLVSWIWQHRMTKRKHCHLFLIKRYITLYAEYISKFQFRITSSFQKVGVKRGNSSRKNEEVSG